MADYEYPVALEKGERYPLGGPFFLCDRREIDFGNRAQNPSSAVISIAVFDDQDLAKNIFAKSKNIKPIP